MITVHRALFVLTFCTILHAQVSSWVTTQDLRVKMEPQAALPWAAPLAGSPTITVDTAKRYQTMLGMGASLEPTTTWNLSQLPDAARREVLVSLLDPQKGAGMSLMRICIGTPDFTGDPWYSYDDVPPGETDEAPDRFSIEKDKRYSLPILRQARAVRPDLLFYASPWSPPAWMKSAGSLIGGSLLPKFYDAYARYFVKFIQAYEREGVPVYAVTIQNEPGVDRARQAPRWHYPSCRWTGEQERDFIRDHLGPALHRAGLKTKIWSYDHNYNEKPSPGDPGIEYPATVLSDAAAAQFTAGVGFHGYEGNPAGMTAFHVRFPGTPIYFTEGSVFGIRGVIKMLDILRNWAASYNAWVIMIDEKKGPNNGPFPPSRTMVTLDSQTKSVAYQADYWLYTQVMRHVQRGAVRVDSADPAVGLRSVAFVNAANRLTLVVANPSDEPATFQVVETGRAFSATLPPKSAGTFLWQLGPA